jgi:hypothetical protein
VRTTLTLDEDVAAELREESRRSGRAFREVVNEALRHGLADRRASGPRQVFRAAALDLGNLRPGLSIDNVGKLIEQVEDPPRPPSEGEA